MGKHVTIIEDDPDVRALLARTLCSEGYDVTELESGAGIASVITTSPVDLVILDIGLPEMDGFSVVQNIRRVSDVAIIIVSGRADLTDRVVGLEIGADDYISKPFEPREILARVRSVLRRGQKVAVPVEVAADTNQRFAFCDWILDASAQSLCDRAGARVNLTSGEFKLLETMVRRANRTLTRDQLMDACYGNNSPAFDRSIDVFVGRLRKKLLDDPRNPQIIRTVRNTGYIFAPRVTKH